MREKLTHWLIFSVLLALIPIAFNFTIRITTGSPVTIVSLVGKGELLIIAVTISARGLGELLMSDTERRMTKLILGGMNIILLILGSLWFGLISAEISVEKVVVSGGSILIFFFVVIISGCCIILPEV